MTGRGSSTAAAAALATDACSLHDQQQPQQQQPGHAMFNVTVCCAFCCCPCSFHVRVMVPCYKEPVAVIRDTLTAALKASLPPGVKRTVYLCDDGKDKEKERLVDGLGPDVMYITGQGRGGVWEGCVLSANASVH
jgi:dihydropteroate synthase